MLSNETLYVLGIVLVGAAIALVCAARPSVTQATIGCARRPRATCTSTPIVRNTSLERS